ncbi:hypothetical protein HPT27_06840 [Permianibacter sp. IMCC34836]|uniref:PIN domain-containing protein n=1 Tax=Permianibacter fluminis TaxID=2738515 RepID=UPI0015523308|nr:PIN domain-containing protein [Permianibacter fluminis]NQD36737.1 hypothetical protein [Permianibacter fluminis]
MNWAFVDYENVRSLESVNLAAYQRVLVFCGPQNKSIKFDALPASGVCHVDLITVPTSSKNNVDFHLAFHMGIEHQRAATDINFHVISNDKGYQGLINHLELLGRSCKLVEPNAASKVTAKKSPAKKPAAKSEPAGKAATQVAKSTSNKAAAGTKASAKTKPKPVTKVKIKANNAAALSEAASKLFAQLQVTGANRPKSKARILSWLKSHVKSLHMTPEPIPETILAEWKLAGMVTLTGSTVSYSDA